jgi:multidrug efflux pump subunit AcrA (membrane-fusion protein)
VPATVAVRPGSLRPVSVPVGGVLEEILVVEGQRVAAGAPVARLRRDAFPRPALVLTDAVLLPLNEAFHEAVAGLRSAAQALAIAREELARVRGVLSASGGVVPTKVEIDLRNEERRAQGALENARHEAERHGLAPEEVAAIEAGGEATTDLPSVERVLARNGLWSERASAVLAALPEDVRRLPYAAAVLGELVGARALTPRMAEAITARPALAASFLDVAGLVQQGWTVESLVALAEGGALEPVVTVRAPQGSPDWDVEAVRARPGDRVEAGDVLAECRDLSRVHLRLAPAGPDLAAIASVLEAGETLGAEPLLAGSGPALEGLRLLRLDADGRDAGGGPVVPAENRVLSLAKEGGREFRSWALRPGLRYVVRVPRSRVAGVFVLPADAVAAQGADTVLLLEDGSGFRAVPVRVEHRDARHVVVANDGAVFPGDRVVLRGAYQVLLALQAAVGGGVDPHAGHSHE